MKNFTLLVVSLFLLVFNIKAQPPGNALDFDGSNDEVYVNMDISPAARPSLTASCWVKRTGTPSVFGAIISNDNGGYDRAINVYLDGTYHIFAGMDIPTGIVSSLNTWEHIAVYWSATEIKMYKNGILVFTTGGEVADPGPAGFSIGCTTGGSLFFPGVIDELRIWNGEREGCLINGAKNFELLGVFPDLLAYYNFNQGIGGADNSGIINLIDNSGNGQNGALFNFTLNGPTSNWITSDAPIIGVFTEPLPVSSNAIVDNNVSCAGYSDGGATVSASGGTPAYSYSWSNGATTASITGLLAGTYTVTTTDQNGCTDFTSVNILNPAPLNSNVSISNVTVWSGSDGAINLTSNGGTTPYSYEWTGPNGFSATTEDISGLEAGTYNYTITDNCGVTFVGFAGVIQPDYCVDNLYTWGCTDTDDIGTFEFADLAHYSSFDECPGGATGYSDFTSQTAHVLQGNSYNISIGTSNINYDQGFGLWIDFNHDHDFDDPGECVFLDGIATAPTLFTGQVTIPNNALPGITRMRARGFYNYTPLASDACTNWSYGETEEYTIEIISCNELDLTDAVITDAGCFNSADGAVDITVTGGTSPLSYTWSNTMTTEDITNLAAGTYAVTVTDDIGCQVDTSVTITEPLEIFVSHTSTPASCGIADGTAMLNIFNGIPPYNEDWGGENPMALAAGTYNVTVTDFSGCSVTHNVIVNNATAPIVTINTTPVTCPGGNDGTASETIMGGLPPYTVNWNGENNSALMAGNYTMVVTDGIGCEVTTGYTINGPAVFSLTPNINNVLCNGDNTGNITLFISGGTPPYNENWGGNNPAALVAGDYSVTVTDFAGCTTEDAFTVTEPTPISITMVDGLYNICQGTFTGWNNMDVSGGKPSYLYNWAGPNGFNDMTPDWENAEAGIYYVTVTDANNCNMVSSVEIIGYPDFLTVMPSETICEGDSVMVYGNWIKNAGTYYNNLLAVGGCDSIIETTVIVNSVIASVAIDNNISCNGYSDGGLSASATGGTLPYMYTWNNGATTASITGLSAGTYTVTITDIDGCAGFTSGTVSEPATLEAFVAIDNNISCNGNVDGALTASATGGTSPYIFAWSNGATTASIIGLAEGTYTVTITDQNGCTSSNSGSITEPTILTSSTVIDAHNSCNGFADGAMTASAAGGTSPYLFMWSNGATTASITGLIAGTYTVTITDQNACTTSNTGTITQPTAIVATTIIDANVSCNGYADGAMTVSTTGGSSPFIYSWNNGATTSSITGLTAGTYSVSIVDQNGCTASNSGSVSEPAPLSAFVMINNNVSCNGFDNGSLTALITGGVASYNLTWDNSETTSTISNLSPGTYNVTATDANGCMALGSETITEPAPLDLYLIIDNNVLCNGDNNGALSTMIVGGTPNYSVLWDDLQTTPTISNLSPGTYSVTATDANGCTAQGSETITEPTVLISSATVVSNVSCNGQSNGAALASATGGTSPYMYNWSNGTFNASLTNVTAGTYTVTVSDQFACSSISSVTIIQPTAITYTTTSVDATCFGLNDGSIDLEVSGGLPGYTYSWSNGATTQDLTGLTSGNYSVTIKDILNCSVQTSVMINGTTQILLSSLMTDATCYGQASGSIDLTVTGGLTPYAYAWSNGETTEDISSLIADNYVVTVTDDNGCQATSSYTIAEPAEIILPATYAEICFGDTYTWEGNDYTTSGVYYANYTSVNGCDSIYELNLTVADELISTITGNDLLCNGVPNLMSAPDPVQSLDFKWLATGCTTPENIRFYINGTLALETVGHTAICDCLPGIRTASVTDPAVIDLILDGNNEFIVDFNNGIEFYLAWAVVTVNQSSSYDIIIADYSGGASTYNPDLCINYGMNSSSMVNQAVSLDNGVSIALELSGGIAPYMFNWSTGETTPNIPVAYAGTYDVTVTDNIGCNTTNTITINEPPVISYYTIATDASCFGMNDGAIDLEVTGGVPGYTYLWNNGATTQDLTGITSGTFDVTFSDANGCEVFTSDVVNGATDLVLNATTTDAICFGQASGSIDLTVVGGLAPYTFAWSNGETTEDISSLIAGNYLVTVTDANGCQASSDYTITEPAEIILPPTYAEICFGDIYTWEGNDYTASGVYYANYTSVNGCDSIYELNLTVADELTTSISGNDLVCNGVPNIISAPDPVQSIEFIWLATGCSGAENIRFYINGNLALETLGHTGSCTCTPGISTVTITDPAIIGLVVNGNNEIIVDYNNSIEFYLAYAIVRLNQTASQDIIIADYSGGASTLNPDLCIGGNGYNSTDIVNQNIVLDSGVSIALEVTGGIPPYMYNWSTGETTQNIPLAYAGTYDVTVTDNIGCNTANTITINEPPVITYNTTATDASCFGMNDGAVDLEVTGGVPGYTYLWNNGATTQDLTGITSGSFDVTITDAGGCEIFTSAVVNGATALSVSFSTIDPICFGQPEGAIDLTVSGGLTPYTYIWNNGAITEDLSAITAGDYMVTITDANGCQEIANVTIADPFEMTFAFSVGNASAWGSNDGSIDVTVFDGISPYTYSWTGPSGFISTDEDIMGLAAGIYNLTITDACGYELISDIEVIQPDYCTDNLYNYGCTDTDDIGTFQFADLSNSTMFDECPGGTTGYADYTNMVAHVNQGGTYNIAIGTSNPQWPQGFGVWIDYNQNHIFEDSEFVWQSPGTSQAPTVFYGQVTIPASALTGTTRMRARGIYNSIPGSSDACTYQSYGEIEDYSIEILDCNDLSLNINSITDASCFGDANGAINVQVSGGNLPLYFAWSNGSTTEDISNVSAGDYTLTVTDGIGCVVNSTITITQPMEILVSSVKTNANCGNADGTVALTITQGVEPYTVDWGGSDPMALSAGGYTVTITDATGCSVLHSFNISNIGAPSVTIFTSNVTCYGVANGSAAVLISGGTPPYVEDWNGLDPQALAGGVHTLTVTDDNGCELSTDFTIYQPSAITVDFNTMNPSCFGSSDGFAEAFVNGGTPPYSYLWESGNTTSMEFSLTSGTHALTVTDNNYCETIASVNLMDPSEIDIAFDVTNVSCPGAFDGNVNMTVTGGSPAYLYNWSPFDNTEDLEFVGPGTYFVTVTDASGCFSLNSVEVTEPASIESYVAASICTGDSLFVQGSWQTTSGTYYDTFIAASGCDSMVTTTLLVDPYVYNNVFAEICSGDSIFAESAWQYMDGTYYDTLSSAFGCDSIVITNLVTMPVYFIQEIAEICSGDSIMLEGAYQYNSGTYTDVYMTEAGCDSIIETELMVHPSYEIFETVEICEGSSAIIAGNTETVAGIYSELLMTGEGCDSIIYTELIVHPTLTNDVYISICDGDSAFIGGSWYYNDAVVVENLTYGIGCDSIVTTTLEVAPYIYKPQYFEICEGGSIFAEGEWQFTSGTYYDTIAATAGCDTVVVTDLLVNPVDLSSDYTEICNGDSIYLGSAWQFVGGIYTDIYTNSEGCDSIVETELVVNPTFESYSYVAICEGDSYFAAGSLQTEEGTYMDMYTTTSGCDSIIITELIVNPTHMIFDQVQLCNGDSAFIEGAWQHNNGVFTEYLINEYGCDSVVQTQLLFVPEIHEYQYVEICNGETFFAGGADQSTSGTYFDTYTAVAGCDSIVETELVVNPVYYIYETAEICEGDSIFIDGIWQTMAGTYVENFSTESGCDSIVETQLFVNPSYNDYVLFNICDGDSVFAAGQWQTASGVYSDTIATVMGCDSITTTEVIVHAYPVVNLGADTALCAGYPVTLDAGIADSYLWSDGSSTQYLVVDSTANGLGTFDFWVVADNFGCTASDTISIFIDICPGYEEIAERLGVNVYPNPNNGVFKVEILNADINTSLEMFDMTGKVISYETITDQKQISHEIDISGTPTGMYYLRITTGTDVSVHKVIIR